MVKFNPGGSWLDEFERIALEKGWTISKEARFKGPMAKAIQEGINSVADSLGKLDPSVHKVTVDSDFGPKSLMALNAIRKSMMKPEFQKMYSGPEYAAARSFLHSPETNANNWLEGLSGLIAMFSKMGEPAKRYVAQQKEVLKDRGPSKELMERMPDWWKKQQKSKMPSAVKPEWKDILAPGEKPPGEVSPHWTAGVPEHTEYSADDMPKEAQMKKSAATWNELMGLEQKPKEKPWSDEDWAGTHGATKTPGKVPDYLKRKDPNKDYYKQKTIMDKDYGEKAPKRRSVRRDPDVLAAQKVLAGWFKNPQVVGKRGPDGVWGPSSSAAWNKMMKATGNPSLATTTATKPPARQYLQWMKINSGKFHTAKPKRQTGVKKTLQQEQAFKKSFPPEELEKWINRFQEVQDVLFSERQKNMVRRYYEDYLGPDKKGVLYRLMMDYVDQLKKQRGAKADDIPKEAQMKKSANAQQWYASLPQLEQSKVRKQMGGFAGTPREALQKAYEMYMRRQQAIKQPAVELAKKDPGYDPKTGLIDPWAQPKWMPTGEGIIKDVEEEMRKSYPKFKWPKSMSAAVINKLVSLANALEDMGISEAAMAVDKQIQLYKDATDKLYDVTGETGEDLIGQAHPGGGPTIADSAEEGGKVETIVEEHKKMVNKTMKAPTGKYAGIIEDRDELRSQWDLDKWIKDEEKRKKLKKLLESLPPEDEEDSPEEELPEEELSEEEKADAERRQWDEAEWAEEQYEKYAGLMQKLIVKADKFENAGQVEAALAVDQVIEELRAVVLPFQNRSSVIEATDSEDYTASVRKEPMGEIIKKEPMSEQSMSQEDLISILRKNGANVKNYLVDMVVNKMGETELVDNFGKLRIGGFFPNGFCIMLIAKDSLGCEIDFKTGEFFTVEASVRKDNHKMWKEVIDVFGGEWNSGIIRIPVSKVNDLINIVLKGNLTKYVNEEEEEQRREWEREEELERMKDLNIIEGPKLLDSPKETKELVTNLMQNLIVKLNKLKNAKQIKATTSVRKEATDKPVDKGAGKYYKELIPFWANIIKKWDALYGTIFGMPAVKLRMPGSSMVETGLVVMQTKYKQAEKYKDRIYDNWVQNRKPEYLSSLIYNMAKVLNTGDKTFSLMDDVFTLSSSADKYSKMHDQMVKELMILGKKFDSYAVRDSDELKNLELDQYHRALDLVINGIRDNREAAYKVFKTPENTTKVLRTLRQEKINAKKYNINKINSRRKGIYKYFIPGLKERGLVISTNIKYTGIMKKAEVDEFMELMKSFAPAKKAPDKKAPGKPKAKRRRRYKKPASDSQVERLQQALMAAGISPGKDDGYWGPRTAAAYNKLIENSKTYGFDKYLKPIQNVGRQRHKMRPQAALNTAIKIAMYIARKQAGARNTITLGSLEFPFTSLSNPKTFLNYLQNVTNTQGAISPKTGMEYLRELVIYVDHNERDLEMKTPGSVRTWKSQLYKLMTAMRSYKPPVVPGQKGTPKTKPAASGNVFLPSPLSTVEDIRKALENLPPLSVVSSPEIFKDTVLPGKPINVQVDRFLKRLHEIKRAILNNQRFLKPHVEKILNRVTRYIPPMISIRNQI